MTQHASRRRRRLFTVIALFIPILFFAVVEGGLRVLGFGEDYPLFVPFAAAPGYLQPNPDVVNRYFADPEQAPAVSIDTQFFLAEKPANGLRLFVQGGSTAAGFPYGNNASPAGLLRKRLQLSFPNQQVEVISTAMAAVNSYTLLDFADEIIAQQPDAVLIYAGHNEFLGILGVGSTFRLASHSGLTRLRLSLRQLRIYQLLQQLVVVSGRQPQPRSGTLMATVAGERRIPLGSQLYDLGGAQFRGNLDKLLQRYKRAGIPVFIATLASNERNQPPFVGSPANDSDAWRTDASRLAMVQRDEQADVIIAVANNLVGRYPTAAAPRYALGQALYSQGAFDTARQAFVDAIDRDQLRFRAPALFNQVIRDLAVKHEATVVDTLSSLRDAAPAGVIGNELMLEHLHPNQAGYGVIADAFYDALHHDELDRDWPRYIDAETARLERPLTRIEILHGEYRVAHLLNDWPFVEQKREYKPPAPRDPEQQIAQAWFAGSLDWIGAMNAGLAHTQERGDYQEAARIAMSMADAFPFEAQPQFVAGQMLIRRTPPQGKQAIPYFHRAATLEPDNLSYLATLAQAYVINGYDDAARDTARRLQQLAPAHPLLRQLRQYLDSKE